MGQNPLSCSTRSMVHSILSRHLRSRGCGVVALGPTRRQKEHCPRTADQDYHRTKGRPQNTNGARNGRQPLDAHKVLFVPRSLWWDAPTGKGVAKDEPSDRRTSRKQADTTLHDQVRMRDCHLIFLFCETLTSPSSYTSDQTKILEGFRLPEGEGRTGLRNYGDGTRRTKDGAQKSF